MKARYCLLLIVLSLVIPDRVCGADRGSYKITVLRRVWSYYQSIDTSNMVRNESYAYHRFYYRTDRRNVTLMAVPSMYAVARGAGREFLCEEYNRITTNSFDHVAVRPLLSLSTVPHHKQVMPNLLCYMTPHIYDTAIFDGRWILSPLKKHNRKYYRYQVHPLVNNKAEVVFHPKTDNTQLIFGKAIVDENSGQVVNMEFDGEYDMVHFRFSLIMGREGVSTLIPVKCDLNATFCFLGNHITSHLLSVYGLKKNLPDSIGSHQDFVLMDSVRPIALTSPEKSVYQRYIKNVRYQDSIQISESKYQKHSRYFLNVMAEQMLSRFNTNFGTADQGAFRMEPILNPFYFEYSHRKGYTYKFDVRGSYQFNSRVGVSLRFKAGYSFNLHQFFFSVPLTFYYNRNKNGYIQMELANGNRITNSLAAEAVKKEKSDSINWNQMDLDYFKDFNWRIYSHYDFDPHWGFEAGFVWHRRSAVNSASYLDAGHPAVYRSVAPALELLYRPAGFRGPVFALDYEQSIKGFCKSNIEYERWEMDGQYIYHLPGERSVSMRLGGGFYTHKGKNWYFLDYSNFREDNIIGGWNDKWSGDFELLNSNWYNASEYYLRGNFTYESPILLVAWFPFIGHFIEKERIYGSALLVNHLHPYTEMGYGVQTRLFSMGAFVATRNGKFDGFGCKFGLELFRNW